MISTTQLEILRLDGHLTITLPGEIHVEAGQLVAALG